MFGKLTTVLSEDVQQLVTKAVVSQVGKIALRLYSVDVFDSATTLSGYGIDSVLYIGLENWLTHHKNFKTDVIVLGGKL